MMTDEQPRAWRNRPLAGRALPGREHRLRRRHRTAARHDVVRSGHAALGEIQAVVV